jgi:ketosteroid isomerase-like protein
MIRIMKLVAAFVVLLSTSLVSIAQDYASQIYDTERAFERAVAEKGIRDGFIEFLSPLGILFRPGPVNGRESWRSRPASPAALTWNPIKIEVSSNGALGYSIGNSIYRPKGTSDTNEIHGHYLSIWTRQANGDYRAALDAGIGHDKPSQPEATWKPDAPHSPEANDKRLFAGDSSIGFFRTAEDRGIGKAYQSYAASDIVLMRDNHLPFVGRNAAVDFAEDQKSSIKFAKRRSFIEAGDLAYVYSTYSLIDKKGVEKEKGNFVQVWKLRDGKWRIAADLFLPLPPA